MVSIVTVLAVGINRITVADEQSFKYEFEPPFFPGISCEDIYNKNSQVRNKSRYYWITDGPNNVYCGMNYTGLSCVDIYKIIVKLITRMDIIPLIIISGPSVT